MGVEVAAARRVRRAEQVNLQIWAVERLELREPQDPPAVCELEHFGVPAAVVYAGRELAAEQNRGGVDRWRFAYPGVDEGALGTKEVPLRHSEDEGGSEEQ